MKLITGRDKGNQLYIKIVVPRIVVNISSKGTVTLRS